MNRAIVLPSIRRSMVLQRRSMSALPSSFCYYAVPVTFVFGVGIFHRTPAHQTNLGADGAGGSFVGGRLGWLDLAIRQMFK